MNDEYWKHLMDEYILQTIIANKPKMDIYGGTYAQTSSAPFDNLDVLHDMNLLERITVVTTEVDMMYHKQNMNSESYKEEVRTNLSKLLSSVCLEKSTFTQIAVCDRDTVKVSAKCIVLSIEEFQTILRRLRSEIRFMDSKS